MSAHPVISTTVTNVRTGGQWIVVHAITTRLGPFSTRADAERFAATLNGAAALDPSQNRQDGGPDGSHA